jgi:hypothetical protein
MRVLVMAEVVRPGELTTVPIFVPNTDRSLTVSEFRDQLAKQVADHLNNDVTKRLSDSSYKVLAQSSKSLTYESVDISEFADETLDYFLPTLGSGIQCGFRARFKASRCVTGEAHEVVPQSMTHVKTCPQAAARLC